MPNCKILELGEHFAQVPKKQKFPIRKRHAQQNIHSSEDMVLRQFALGPAISYVKY